MSSVIKSSRGGFSGLPQGILVVDSQAISEAMLDESDPRVVAKRLVAEAEEQARGIVAAAESRAAAIEEAAREAGLAQATREVEARWEGLFERVQEQAEILRREREELLDVAEPELAKLSIEIAKKVIKQELTQNEEAVLAVVRAAIHRIKDKEVRVLVNPRDLETVRGAREEFANITDGVTELEIVSDRRVGQGGCVLETPSGNLDARLETQLAHISEIIAKDQDGQLDAA